MLRLGQSLLVLPAIVCAAHEEHHALLQSSAVLTQGLSASEGVASAVSGEFRSYLAGLSAEQLTSETVCDLDRLDKELSGLSCEKMPHTVMVHIPKTAGTFLEFAGLMRGLRWGCHMSFAGCTQSNAQCHPWHVPPSWMHQPNIYEGRDVFCVTRDPYERMLSEYRYFDADCKPRRMNYQVKQWLEAYKRGDKELNGCHLVPQSEYVWGRDGRQWCQTILRLEDFPHALDSFMASRNLTLRNTHATKVQSNTGQCQRLHTSDFDAHNIQLINEIYHEDFERLNYAKRSV
mmetsp:Transcript_46473/g.85150  ORF Transcript_46473/g.85150 Transcript_46473/m.85150 type:complete len:289 (-) Transcript_46473:129-995(-)